MPFPGGYQPGDEVTIVKGPLTGYQGVIRAHCFSPSEGRPQHSYKVYFPELRKDFILPTYLYQGDSYTPPGPRNWAELLAQARGVV